jgi:hypothetical protein
MSHPVNNERADSAAAALASYGGGGDMVTGGALESLTDFLSDLMHLCDREGIDFDHQLESARNHFNCEAGEGDDIEQDRRRLWEADHKDSYTVAKGGAES